jgi:nitroreductase
MIAGDKTLTGFMDVVKIRRSYRRYSDSPVEDEKLALLHDVVREATRSLGCNHTTFIFVTNKKKKNILKRAIFSGLMGKVNPWILTTSAYGFIVACGYPGKGADTEKYLAEGAMLMEILILGAAELGLATCWLGGFGEAGVKKALTLPDDVRVFAITPLGYPPDGIKISSWDYMVRNLVSKRRLPINKIVTML